MKTTSFYTKISLSLLVAGTLAACNQNKPAAGGTTAAAAPSNVTISEPSKEAIVYVNSDTLLAKYDYAKDVQARMTNKGKAAQNDVEDKGRAFQKEVADYQKNASTMAADARQSTEQKLQREQQQLQAYQQNASAQFASEREQENEKLYDKIADFVKTYAKQKGYKLVLTFSKANPTVLYGDPSLDVTADVVKQLNDAYAAKK